MSAAENSPRATPGGGVGSHARRVWHSPRAVAIAICVVWAIGSPALGQQAAPSEPEAVPHQQAPAGGGAPPPGIYVIPSPPQAGDPPAAAERGCPYRPGPLELIT